MSLKNICGGNIPNLVSTMENTSVLQVQENKKYETLHTTNELMNVYHNESALKVLLRDKEYFYKYIWWSKHSGMSNNEIAEKVHRSTSHVATLICAMKFIQYDPESYYCGTGIQVQWDENMKYIFKKMVLENTPVKQIALTFGISEMTAYFKARAMQQSGEFKHLTYADVHKKIRPRSFIGTPSCAKSAINLNTRRIVRMTKKEEPEDAGLKRYGLNNEQYKLIWKMHQTGSSDAEIGTVVGRTKGHVRNVLEGLCFINYDPNTFYAGEIGLKTRWSVQQTKDFIQQVQAGVPVGAIARAYKISEISVYYKIRKLFHMGRNKVFHLRHSVLENLEKRQRLHLEKKENLNSSSDPPNKKQKLSLEANSSRLNERCSRKGAWSKQDYETIWKLHKEGKETKYIAEVMKRGSSGVKHKLRDLESIYFNPNTYFEGKHQTFPSYRISCNSEDELIRLLETGESLKDIALYFELSEMQIYMKLRTLRKEGRLKLGYGDLAQLIKVGSEKQGYFSSEESSEHSKKYLQDTSNHYPLEFSRTISLPEGQDGKKNFVSNDHAADCTSTIKDRELSSVSSITIGSSNGF
eukprot:maker-scaffold_1-snap-gene-11.35-mRNA-1 protein AED:0.24 eAED:0.24 QI:153/1/1/1/1/1/2/590/579